MSSIPYLDGHRCARMIFFGMLLEVILDRLLEFSKVNGALRRNNLEVKLCFLPWIRPGCFDEHKPDLLVAQRVKWDALVLRHAAPLFREPGESFFVHEGLLSPQPNFTTLAVEVSVLRRWLTIGDLSHPVRLHRPQ